jgi:hypothetical protein
MQDEQRSSIQVEDAPTDAAGADPEHSHRWRIEAQGGPESAGRCACGAEKSFANSYTSEQTNTYRRGQRRA